MAIISGDRNEGRCNTISFLLRSRLSSLPAAQNCFPRFFPNLHLLLWHTGFILTDQSLCFVDLFAFRFTLRALTVTLFCFAIVS